MINANTSSEWSSDSKPKTIRNAPYFVGKAASPRLLTFIGVKYITQDFGVTAPAADRRAFPECRPLHRKADGNWRRQLRIGSADPRRRVESDRSCRLDE